MKILVIGGNGTIGTQVVSHLKKGHDVFVADRTKGDVLVDITSSESIRAMFKKTPVLDAILCIAGDAKWDHFEKLGEEDYYVGIKSKLMGQVNLVRIGKDFLAPKGSITLTSGILADHPVKKTASAAMVNGAIHSFVKAAALELNNGVRLNVVSASLVNDSYEKYKAYFKGHQPVAMDKVAAAYMHAIMDNCNGHILRIYENVE